MSPQLWIAGAALGVVWWAISLVMGAYAYGILGTYPATGLVAGLLTGLLMTAVSVPAYRRLPIPTLLWYSPLSVYLSIALYGAFVFLCRLVLDDFHPSQIRSAVGTESVIGMWWGATFLLQVALPVHLLAYGSHRLLRALTHARTNRTRSSREPRGISSSA